MEKKTSWSLGLTEMCVELRFSAKFILAEEPGPNAFSLQQYNSLWIVVVVTRNRTNYLSYGFMAWSGGTDLK